MKMTYAPNCVNSSDLKETGVFVILPSQNGFESDCPETKFQTITFKSEAAVHRCSSRCS